MALVVAWPVVGEEAVVHNRQGGVVLVYCPDYPEHTFLLGEGKQARFRKGIHYERALQFRTKDANCRLYLREILFGSTGFEYRVVWPNKKGRQT